ncbi:MAG TPA: porin family protein [Cytophagaceae bacterium]|nr:porin family protein [Cytophagaceae bacterium]
MRNLLLSVFFVLFISIGNNINAESASTSDSITCTQKLNKAQKAYDAGQLSEVEGFLSKCIDDGFSKEEKMQALRLLILASLFQDEHGKAETNLLRLLKEDPEYVLNPAIDPAEFYELYNSYRTLPIINVGIMGGITTTNVFEKQTYSVGSEANNKPTYKSRFGYQGGIVTDILLYRKFQLHVGGLFSIKNFTYTNTFLYNNATKLTSKESQMWLDAPVAIKYNIGNGKLKVYALAGGSFGFLINANSKLSRENSDNSNAAKEGTEKFKKIRSPYNVAALVGLGIRYKIGYGYVFIDGRYSMGLKNIANVKNRYFTDDGSNLFYYGYVSSDFNINNLMISVGYMKSIYKPKKIRKIEEQ